MHLTLTPVRGLPGQPETTISVAADTVTVDGVSFDLSPIPEGGSAMPSGDHPFIGPITRTGGVLHVVVRVILGDDAAPDQPASPWVLPAASGAIAIPAARLAKEGPQI